ncbi:MAG: hypothetical protein M1839_005360 [Geoglossum umbratile]|nr:MAG: hypothetical protein M1839_005360 [Geoglossum umbratile]
MVSVALKYIWANRYFPDEFISNRELALPSLPDRGEKLFDDASKRVVAERPQEGRILCCAYLTCANQLHRLAFDQSFGKEKLDLLEGVRLSYLQHVGECGDVEFYRYWEELVVSVGSEIRELAMHRRITATAYYTFKDLIEAISSQNEFSSIAENQLVGRCLEILKDERELCRRFRLLIVVFTALKSMDLIQRVINYETSMYRISD